MGDTMNQIDYVARAEALAPLIAEHADDAERQRRLPRVVADAMSDAGLYRVAASVEQLGGGADAVTQIKVIEAVSRVDGSTGWNLMIGIETYSLMIAGLMRNRELIEDPRVIVAGSTAAVGNATPVDGGYQVSGHWKFVSGCHNAGLFSGLVNLLDDGADAPPPNPVPSMAVLPASEIEILDTWHTTGLAGSGSNDYRVDAVFVPEEHSFDVFSTPKRTEPLYGYHGFFFANVPGIPFGIAHAALDAARELADSKRSMPSFTLLREDPEVQTALGEAEASLAASRAYVRDAIGSAWETLLRGDPLSLAQRSSVGLCLTFAGQSAGRVVELACGVAGSTALYRKSPLERLRRDMIAVNSHIVHQRKTYGLAYRMVLDENAGPSFL